MPKPRTPAPQADPVRRASRSAFQTAIVAGAVQGYNLFFNPDLNPEQTAWIMLVGIPLVSLIQNLLETNGFVPEMLKGPPAPVPADNVLAQENVALAQRLADHDRELAAIHADIARRPPEPRGEVPFRG